MNTNTSYSVRNKYDKYYTNRSTSQLNQYSSALPAINESSKRYATKSLTTPPQAYRSPKPIPDFQSEIPLTSLSVHNQEIGYGPGTIEYELAVDYLSQSLHHLLQSHYQPAPTPIPYIIST